ncbi:MAG: ABC transporter permease [Polyangiaceae bacterium]
MKRAARSLASVLSGVLGRTSGALLTLVALATLVFLALRLLPGDPAALVLGEQAPRASSPTCQRLGLDQPLVVQYLHFLAGLARLDLGDSLARPGTRARSRRWAERSGPTAGLAGLSVALGSLLGISVAVLSVGPWLGARREWLHRATLAVAALPLLAFAPLATYVFAVRAAWVPLPGDPESGLAGLGFAAGLLALPLAAQVARIGRAALLDLGRAKFLDAARARGGSAFRVWVIHALPAASAPISVVIAAQLGALLGGAVVLEKLFERPGLGTLMLSAYAARDIPVLEASVVAAGLLFVAVQALAAALSAGIDPRGRGT